MRMRANRALLAAGLVVVVLLCLLVGLLHVTHTHAPGQGTCDLCLVTSQAFTVPAAPWSDLLPRRAPMRITVAPAVPVVQVPPCMPSVPRAPPASLPFA